MQELVGQTDNTPLPLPPPGPPPAAAVQELAGQTTGLSALDKVTEAVNIIKVLKALKQMNELLKASGRWGGVWGGGVA